MRVLPVLREHTRIRAARVVEAAEAAHAVAAALEVPEHEIGPEFEHDDGLGPVLVADVHECRVGAAPDIVRQRPCESVDTQPIRLCTDWNRNFSVGFAARREHSEITAVG